MLSRRLRFPCPRTALRLCILPAAVAVLLTVPGCGDDPVTGAVADCPVDPALVAERADCLADDQCPCGTHCDLGICEAACTVSADCAEGERCDGFGRCRAAGETALVPAPLESRAEADVQPLSPFIQVDSLTGEGTLRLVATQGTDVRVRVLGREGAEVLCDGTWVDECELPAVIGGDELSLDVRYPDMPADGGAGTGRLAIFSTGGPHAVVSVTRQPDAAPGPPFEAAPFEGAYEGAAQLVSAGLGDAADPGPAPVGPVRLPLTASVHGTLAAAILVIDNHQGAFGSAGALVGNFALTDMGRGLYEGTASFPAQPFLEGDLGAGAEYAVLAETVEATVRLRENPRLVEVDLVQRFVGLGPATQPLAAWRVSLTRAGDLTTTAPAVPADATLPADPAVLESTFTPWELRIASLFRTYVTRSGWPHFWDLWRPVSPGWESCFPQEDAGSVRGRAALGVARGGGYYDPARAAMSPDPESYYRRESPVGAAMMAAFDTSSVLPIYPVARYTYAGTLPGGTTELPCVGRVEVTLPLSGETLRADEAFDNCARLRELTGCTVSTPAAELSFAFTLDVSDSIVGAAFAGTAAVTARWTQSCTLPDAPPACAATAACIQPERTSQQPVHEYLGAPFGAVSGDATCTLSGGSAAVGIDQLTDLGTATARGAIDDCLADIARLRGAPPERVMGNVGENLVGLAADPSTSVLDVGTCLDPARFLLSIRHGLRAVRGDDDPSPEVAEAGAFALRRMARWLEIHGFIASEAASQGPMAAVMQGMAAEPPPAVERLRQSIAGWDLIFHPRFAGSLGQLSGAALQQLDYRVPALGVTPGQSDAQGAGLPTAIFDTIARQMALLDVVLEEAAFDSDPAAAAVVSEVLPRTVLAGALAWGLHGRAVAAATGDLDWGPRYEAAEARALTAFSGAQGRARTLATGGNPLGIEDADLPLYFVAEGTAADGSFGPGGRYAAVSDFLLGADPGSTAWAPTLVRQAGESLDSARARFVAEADRGFRVAVAAADHQRWVDEVRDQYDQRLFDYCGSIGGSPVSDPNFQAATCAIDSVNPSCAMSPVPWYSRWTEADLLGRICVARAITADEATAFADAATREFIDRCVPIGARDTSGAWDVLSIDSCGAGMCLACQVRPDIGTHAIDNHSFELLPVVLPGSPPAMALADVHPATIRAEAVALCAAAYPGMRDEVPRPASAIDKPACVSGALGEAYLDVTTATRALASARAAHAELLESYDIAMKSCAILSDTADESQRLRGSHESRMAGLITGRAVADSAAATAGAAKDCMATVAGSDKTTPWGAIAGGVATAGACIAGGLEAAANIASIGLSAEIENVQRRHEADMEALQEGSSVRICYNDALAELVGLRRTSLDIEQAAFDVQRAHASVDGLLADTQRVWAAGHHYLAEVEGSAVRPSGGDIWIDEEVETFVRRMRLARRATYLALRAVEFEQQRTLAARADVFDAATPAELEAVLQSLWTTAGTRTVAGSRPSDLAVVLSLRDDVLQIADESYLPEGERPLTAIERFRLELANPAYAVYDDAGQWLGQRVPFELAPLGTFGFETRAVPIYAGTDCAERIWSVNASVLGESVMSGTDASFVRVDLLKRNTFFSQWCGEAPPGQPFQMASTRPTRNLFREPGVGESVGGDLGTEFDVTSETRARIQAFVGVDRASLEAPTYANGESSELAARGLFGEYALFIPAATIAREATDGSYSPGLVLDRVDDVLLRLDYVSVAAR